MEKDFINGKGEGMMKKFSSKPLLIRAFFGIGLFIIFHFLDFRKYTAILSITSPHEYAFGYKETIKMALYVLSYFYALVISPILIISAILLSRVLGRN